MKPDFVFVCKKCGKRQVPDYSKSNDNWTVYDNVPCECGGDFEMQLRPKEV